MFRIMLQKLWHKRWMNLCLLLGSILLIATVVSFPLYQSAACERMLQDEFRSDMAKQGRWPAMLSMITVSKKDRQGTAIRRMEELMAGLEGQLGIAVKETLYYYLLNAQEVHSAMNRTDMGDQSLRLGTLSGLPDHAEMLSGEMFSEKGLTEDGSIEVVVSQAGMVKLDLLVGETILFDNLKDAEGKPLKLFIKGVFAEGSGDDFYWQVDPDEMENVCLMQTDLFRRMFTGENAARYTITCRYLPLFDYESIRSDQVASLAEATRFLTEESDFRSTMDRPAYQDILENYLSKQGRIQATLLILQVPVLIMLGAFLFMISGQMYEMERNEISVIKSRGSSGGQIFRLYLYQSTFLTLTGSALGIPLGAVFSRVLGSARSFLEFEDSGSLQIVFTAKTWGYAAGAMAASLCIMALPAIRHSRVTIVKLKQQKALKKKSWWEKIFLDVILLALSLYGYYSYHKNQELLAQSVLMGEPLDPLLYISSSLFIVGAGLLFLRLQPLIVQLIYLAGKRFWRPASYASFLENRKNGRKQQFIMLFLIMTISLGMYHATVARSILQNARENAEYLDGADIVIREVWPELQDENGAGTGNYLEPDVTKYIELDWAESYTRVLYDEHGYIGESKSSRQEVTVMGIHTKDFGEITWLPVGLTEKHYYEYLNELAVEKDGLLVSEAFRSRLGMKVGDTLTCYNSQGLSTTGKIVDFFEYWPGYTPTATVVNPDGTVSVGDNYLVVTHYDRLRQLWGVAPYEIWLQLKEGYDSQDVIAWIQDNDVHVRKFTDKAADVQNAVEDPLLQGTNGVLTMGFIVTILLCGVGYLIYWIMSIRSREMIFGVLRACGMHKGELFHMLMNEQIFSGVFSVFAGIGIGKLASVMFVPILQQAYAASNQVLPMKLVVNASDMMRLYGVIAGVMIVCLLVLILLLLKMNVAKALKLGEE
ncbi:MAG: ABC transporter permease [Lachnospiraceae bacterium]|jgi:putative ABC transport system permease protein|nr:ABC transporter permease [Lachnospiraceae bacterium]